MLINVILAIDERLEDVQRCVESLRKTYGMDAPIALATYGGADIGPQPAVGAYATKNGFLYADVVRHDFLTEDDTKEWHACELLARLQITKHFADLGYEEIYIMHADVRILGDFRKSFQPADNKWSFVAFLVRARESFAELCKKGSWGLYFEGNPARLADILVRYNTLFVARVYEIYDTPQQIWEKWLSKFTVWGDLAQFDVARDWEGYTGRCIPEKTDLIPMCGGRVLHEPRQVIPACLSDGTRKGLDRDGVVRNYERRIKCAT